MSEAKYRCSRCGRIKHSVSVQCVGENADGTHFFYSNHDWRLSVKDNVTLSLLFVVMGEKEVVMKIEKSCPDLTNWLCVNNGWGGLYSISGKGSQLIRESFVDIRAAVDKLAEGEKPPVPRLERNGTDDGYALWNNDNSHYIPDDEYNALSEIAGKPLKVWKPTRGVWQRLVEGGTSFDPTVVVYNQAEGATFTIWRFQIIEGK